MMAIIMAGGRGSRMDFVEKPLIRIGNETMLERVANALSGADLDALVAVSEYTPKTAEKAREMGLRVVGTPGDGYIPDCQFLLDRFNLDSALVVSADLPFISPKLIREVIEEYNQIRKPLCVAISEREYTSMGFTPSITIRDNNEVLVPVGINVMERKEKENHIHIISGRGAININTIKELERVKCQ
ncbi:MAG: NTP transferase domain-containing protein [Candidatus Altiarchaeales archaeon]|nr:NTP transferase domain-containing protein [Candidatus Altiarchaeota archaeon]MBU4406885.1 NTP transferase domain-containing protein [Candidatus Altiarchaeota archaeon]MCG2782396.1 NTP transferase domain-containing protein [Candidatus Altiarchaeales archaeon]